MSAKTASVHRRATLAIDQLLPKERKTLFKTLQTLQERGRSAWPERGVTLLKTKKPLYRIRIRPDLNVFFSVGADDELVIEDLLRQEALDYMTAQPAGESK